MDSNERESGQSQLDQRLSFHMPRETEGAIDLLLRLNSSPNSILLNPEPLVKRTNEESLPKKVELDPWIRRSLCIST